MAQKTRKLVEEHADKLIELLNKAYADELVAYFYYKTAALLVKGIHAKTVADQLEEIAKEEMEHSEELAERIIQLGGEPIDDWDEITKKANYPKVDIPKDRSDYESILKAVHVAEQGAIEVYADIINFLQKTAKDPVTFHVIRHIMGEEMHHEEEVETLLGL
ncbi:ferritin-like domain-containing protein [Acetomicrobium hydrogeniformans]|uniref:Bacterioferritin n=1 Tax=Acetomicrobium hydrogeniformans TaxID=649746 RepID=A0A7V7BYA2_9BACT|nr:ferritin-like domain-containing protein [Acetomicrobium hydrogeniformans]HHZ04381.1 bacterioferritin [Acetomicrobium hydrogeniformans]